MNKTPVINIWGELSGCKSADIKSYVSRKVSAVSPAIHK